MTIIENIAGTVGGATGSIIGLVTFVGIYECILYASIGAVTGFITVRLCKFIVSLSVKSGKNIHKKYIRKK